MLPHLYSIALSDSSMPRRLIFFENKLLTHTNKLKVNIKASTNTGHSKQGN
jgi:hypothetical protein